MHINIRGTHSRKIAPGIYDFTVLAQIGSTPSRWMREFEIERYPDGNWLLFEAAKSETSNRIFCNDFATKRAAQEAAVAITKEG